MTLMSRNEYFAGVRDAIQNLADQWALKTYQKIRDAHIHNVEIDGFVVELEDGGCQIITAYHNGTTDVGELDDPDIARYIFHRVRSPYV